MRLRILLVLCAALALTVGVATATADHGKGNHGKGNSANAKRNGGNSANAKKCQKGGWKTLQRSNGSSFKNQGACVSYAAHSALVQKTKSQLDCESFGSVFSTNPASDLSGITNLPGGTFIWSCNGVTLSGSRYTTLSSDCVADTNGLFVFGNANQSANYSCFRF